MFCREIKYFELGGSLWHGEAEFVPNLRMLASLLCSFLLKKTYRNENNVEFVMGKNLSVLLTGKVIKIVL